MVIFDCMLMYFAERHGGKRSYEFYMKIVDRLGNRSMPDALRISTAVYYAFPFWGIAWQQVNVALRSTLGCITSASKKTRICALTSCRNKGNRGENIISIFR